MARSLDVYLGGNLIGRLTQNDHGLLEFRYTEDRLSSVGPTPLSKSLPLGAKIFEQNECRGFFGGILPEDSQRQAIARNLGISERNDFALLEKIGGECAGAVSILPTGEPLPDGSPTYRMLSTDELAETLRELPRRPLLAGVEGVRLSLAGAQNKLAVHVSLDGISVPLNGAPSTHILKPASKSFPGLIANEAFCLDLAKSAGLSAATAELRSVGGMEFLLIERYDRISGSAKDGQVERLHQEDFCQALGIPSDQKYQNEGGPSLKQCFELIREASSVPAIDLRALLDTAIFNFLIGNHDAHGKNFSLLYMSENGRVRTGLAPLYDLICTLAYPVLDRKMAMKIGGEYESKKIYPRHFERLVEEAGLAGRLAKGRVVAMALTILDVLPQSLSRYPMTKTVAKIIADNCDEARDRFQ